MLVLLSWTELAIVQEVTDPDVLFQEARELAFSGERDAARAILYRALTNYPDYHDLRILVGRTFAWDGDYAQARRELETVLARSPDYTDASRALVDAEIWSGNYDRALEVALAGLSHAPGDEELLYKQARVLWNLERIEDALEVTDRLLALHPEHADALSMRQSLRLESIRDEVYGYYGYESFSDIDYWQSAAISATHRFPFGSVIGRINWANRFDSTAWQFEVDSYPSVRPGVYAYVNYGYSEESFFPNHRAGSELYFSMPRGTEGSAGFRFLRFGDSNTWIYTGSFGWYRGNYWHSLRPYITPSGDGNASASLAWQFRRYFADADDYIGFRFSGGSAPEDATDVTQIDRLWNTSASMEWQNRIATTNILSWQAGYTFEQLTQTRERHRVWASVGWTKRF